MISLDFFPVLKRIFKKITIFLSYSIIFIFLA